MLKFLFMILMIIPLTFKYKMFWMVQNMMFLVSFLFILMNFYSHYFMNLSYFLGCDMLSYGMILLSLWICSLMLLASESVVKYDNYKNLFLFNILMLLLFLFLTFSTMNLFMFYLFFESSLIPTMFLILGWGYQPERLQAGVYLLFYTLLASLPMLVCIFFLYLDLNTLNFYLLMNNLFTFELLYLGMILAFLVKMPMFLVHLWLPKAHVEAPVSSLGAYSYSEFNDASNIMFIASFFGSLIFNLNQGYFYIKIYKVMFWRTMHLYIYELTILHTPFSPLVKSL